MKVLSIDPGYERLGISIIEKEETSKEKLLFSECFQTDKKLSHSERLSLIHKRIEEIIDEYSPNFLAIETLFFNTNQKTAMMVAESRGTVIGLCAAKGLSVLEISPLQIKAAVTGHGRSDKNAVIKMIPYLINLEKEIKFDDEYDAIATGLAFFAMQNNIHR